jgi:hypothetical protein
MRTLVSPRGRLGYTIFSGFYLTGDFLDFDDISLVLVIVVWFIGVARGFRYFDGIVFVRPLLNTIMTIMII